MRRLRQLPITLTIAGSDSGGGAGAQADLKTFAALGVHGTSALTCITAQNPRRVLAVEACSPEILRLQLEALFAELKPAAVKTGMLLNAANIRVVAAFFKNKNRPPLIVDPVCVSTSGAVLLKPSAMKVLKSELLPLATLVTPNLDEAQLLTGQKISTVADLKTAAQKIHSLYGCAALVKGGHLRDSARATDIFFDGKKLVTLSAPFIRGVHTHGTGCTYSAAIASLLARGHDLPRAVALAKRHITRAIANSYSANGHAVLGATRRSLNLNRNPNPNLRLQ
jgi:hydroxymethylpyrimidine/phosphomethylpyrimidine kinase